MNPIERLEALAEWFRPGLEFEFGPRAGHSVRKELRAVIEALKQRDEAHEAELATVRLGANIAIEEAKRLQAVNLALVTARHERDEAVRKVAEEMGEPTFAAPLAKTLSGMSVVVMPKLEDWAARLRAALEDKHE